MGAGKGINALWKRLVPESGSEEAGWVNEVELGTVVILAAPDSAGRGTRPTPTQPTRTDYPEEMPGHDHPMDKSGGYDTAEVAGSAKGPPVCQFAEFLTHLSIARLLCS